MKDREPFSDLRVEGPVVVRMDGVNFGKYSKALGKQRDERVHRALVSSAKKLVEYYSCDSAYASSDEVSVYCKIPPFGGRVEKLVSVFSSFLGSHFSREVSPLPPGWFDGRAVLVEDWRAYVLWRLKVTVCNYASSVAKKPCSRALKEVHLPPEAFGTLLERVETVKKGINPLTGEEVEVTRRVLKEFRGEEVLKRLELNPF